MRRGERERERSQQATYVDWSKDEKDNGGAWVILVAHGLFSLLSTALWTYYLLLSILTHLLGLILTGENRKFQRAELDAGRRQAQYFTFCKTSCVK